MKRWKSLRKSGQEQKPRVVRIGCGKLGPSRAWMVEDPLGDRNPSRRGSFQEDLISTAGMTQMPISAEHSERIGSQALLELRPVRAVGVHYDLSSGDSGERQVFQDILRVDNLVRMFDTRDIKALAGESVVSCGFYFTCWLIGLEHQQAGFLNAIGEPNLVGRSTRR